ncbi:DUF4870 domain-containing protein [Siphonobacter aquaeclarae]|jgi:uncharacterized Tic20 family protein|uniref:DUF4870 domain-containing protein n=1 Tax=Siphonobacter aquaeclarae TaxID=563176 RepID=A0A1G9L6A5_9BACT|nr:DUF4870 domain-containing protein [Siphonobacter aquaeclarae]MBO9640150.1 DUF4870 domain-containing protein [Siphonobacter aquaeclarae]SDL57277.1 hypothetical protein SAMN04488090_1276 [Siphonobacter aquaeclarae]
MENQNIPPIPPEQQLSDSDARMWGMLAHLSGIIFGFVGPLVVWLINKDKSAFVDYHGKEALNFTILLNIVIIAVAVVTCGIGGLLAPVFWAVQVIFNIIAGIKANNGEYYKYPFNWRIIK